MRRLGAAGALLAVLLALGWLPPLNDAVYPPPEASVMVSPVPASASPTPGASFTPTALVVPTAEPTFAPSVRWLTAPVEATIEPRVDVSVSGIASWYRYRPGEAAAGPALRVGNWRGSVVTVCGRVCLPIVLTDACQCYGTRLIDLDRESFAVICGPPSVGLCEVVITP